MENVLFYGLIVGVVAAMMMAAIHGFRGRDQRLQSCTWMVAGTVMLLVATFTPHMAEWDGGDLWVVRLMAGAVAVAALVGVVTMVRERRVKK